MKPDIITINDPFDESKFRSFDGYVLIIDILGTTKMTDDEVKS
jgi:hypothetical protein